MHFKLYSVRPTIKGVLKSIKDAEHGKEKMAMQFAIFVALANLQEKITSYFAILLVCLYINIVMELKMFLMVTIFATPVSFRGDKCKQIDHKRGS